MTLSETVEHQLPYLRRYARAVAGGAALGDLAVEAMLQRLIASMPGQATRVSLFGALDETLCQSDLWASGRIIIASPGRRSLLLTAMEGFSMAEAAAILGVAETDIAALAESAGKDISRPQPARVFIIEDEPLIVASLSQIVVSLGHAIAGIASTQGQALQAVFEAKPDLILADIQLADGSQGTAALAQIRRTLNVPAVFITAFPERLLTGKAGEPDFLITKPFKPAQVRAVIGQALFIQSLRPA